MKKFLTTLIYIFIFSNVFAQTADNKTLPEFAAVNTIESKFTISKYLSIADKPLISGGRFYFQRPDKLYWEYEMPYSYGFLIFGDRVSSWEEKDGKREVKDITKHPAAKEMAAQLHTFVSMDMDKISKIYEIEYIEDGIILYPKNKSKKQMVRDIKIYFAKDIIAVREVVISERAGDKTIIIFTDTKIDETLPQNAFTI